MVRIHAWEQPRSDPPLAAAYAEAHAAMPGPAPAPTPEELEQRAAGERAEAGGQLAELLLQLHVDGQLSAKATCSIGYWAVKAGAAGPVRGLAYNPSAPTGHFQRHLDRMAGLRGAPDEFISIPVPSHTKHSRDRAVQMVRVYPPHECLHREVVADPAILEQVRPELWPEEFHSHPVIRAATPAKVLPLAFYMDAAQYTKGGAAVVVFVVCNLASGSRHLVAILKKKDFCRCGCRGWCSLRPIFAYLDWSFCALAAGTFPLVQPDGAPWAGSDPGRRSLAGLPLAVRGAVVHVKGDWAEYAHSLGFPTWRHSEYPCIWCRCDRDTLYHFDLESTELPFGSTDQAEYEDACARCERLVALRTAKQQQDLAAALFWDKRTLGSRGRTLKCALPELNLLAGDRLEPSAECPDVGEVEHLGLPVTLVFWRPSLETITKHRNPLFNRTTGIGLHSLTVDVLHCFYLGVLQVHCSRILWALFEADAWSTREAGHSTAQARLQESCTRLQADLAHWCRLRARAYPHEKITLVQDISPYIVGASAEDQKLGLKGGETKTVFLYLCEFLPRCRKRVHHKAHMMDANAALKQHMDILRDAPHRLSPEQEQDLAGKRHNPGNTQNNKPGGFDLSLSFHSRHLSVSSQGSPRDSGGCAQGDAALRRLDAEVPPVAAQLQALWAKWGGRVANQLSSASMKGRAQVRIPL